MKIIHLRTIVQTEFASVDDNGNVVEEFAPLQLRIAVPEKAAFDAIPDAIAQMREKLCQPKEL